MRSTVIATILLVGSALAVPHHNKGYQHQGLHHCRRHEKGCQPSALGSAAPVVTGTGLHTINATSLWFVTSALPPTSVPSVASSPEASGIQGGSGSNGPGGAGVCKQNTVTVTDAKTVTVTVAADATSSSAPVQQSPDEADEPNSEPAVLPSASPTASVSQVQAEDTARQEEEDHTSSTASTPSNSVSSAAAASSSASDAATDKKPSSKAPAQQGGPPFKTKRGIIASGDSMNDIAGASGVGKVSWLGNWYSAPPHTLAASLTFVPQMYGKDSDNNGEWMKNAAQAVAKGAKYMLSFGEPGTPSEKLHMEPAEAVQLWSQKMEPFAKQGVSIGAPGTLQNTQDFDWLSKFLDACTDCTIGFVAMHWFDKAGDKQVPGFKETLQKAKVLADKHNLPVWLDNFSAEGDAAAQKKFLGQVVPWLEEQEWIKAYAYVSPEVGKAGSGGAMVEGGKLNDLGLYYANL